LRWCVRASSLLAHEGGGLHFLGGDLALANAIGGAHLLHGADVARLEVHQALVEAVNLGLDHETRDRVLVVRCGAVDKA